VFFIGFVLFVIHFSYFMACVALALLFWLVACLYYYAIPSLEFSVSLVVPLYQKENEIERCLSSAEKALEQANVDYEIIVVDDGSSDNSARIVQDWKRKNEVRKFKTHLIRQENQGVSAARNAGWRAAAKEWVAFLDADDEWRLDHVIRLKALALDFPSAVLLATAWSEVGTDGRPKSHEFGVGTDKRGVLPCFFKAMATGPMVISSSTACARKSALEKTGGFPEGVRLGEDKVAWGRLALLGPVAYDPEIGAIWHKDAQNRSDGPQGPQVSDAFLRLFVEPALEDEATPEKHRPGLEDARLVELARINGVISIYDHDTPEKLRSFVKSL
jgi:glycosyltransferase involved in cell wall biosynthesis